jgi:predicted nuclease with TOPRIM domain
VARKAVIEDRKDLHGSYQELNKDRAELRRDIRSGASKQEILQDRREIRGDMKKIDANRKDLRQSQEKLQAAHRELKSDVHGR